MSSELILSHLNWVDNSNRSPSQNASVLGPSGGGASTGLDSVDELEISERKQQVF